MASSTPTPPQRTPLGTGHLGFNYGEGNVVAATSIKLAGDAVQALADSRKKAFGEEARRHNDNLDYAWRTDYATRLAGEQERATATHQTALDVTKHRMTNRENVRLGTRVANNPNIATFQSHDTGFNVATRVPKATRKTTPKASAASPAASAASAKSPAAKAPAAKAPAAKAPAAKAPAAKSPGQRTAKQNPTRRVR